MKKILKNSIINIPNTQLDDSIFLFDVLSWDKEKKHEVEIIYISDLLEKKKNLEMLEKAKQKPASYSNVFSPKDELEIFTQLFNDAITN